MTISKSKLNVAIVFSFFLFACSSQKDLNTGKKLIDNGEYLQGLKHINNYLNNHPKSQEALLLKVYAESALEDYPSARLTYQKIFILFPDKKPFLYNDYGSILYKLNMVDSAVHYFRIAYSLDSNGENIHYNLAVVYHHEYNNDSIALFHIGKELAINPTHENSLLLASDILLSENDLDSSGAYIDRLLMLNPRSHDALFTKGIIWFRKQEYDSALSYYTKAIENAPLQAEYYTKRAATYGVQKKYYPALKDCFKAIEIDSNYLNAYIVRFNTYLRLDDLTNACEDLNHIERIDPGNESLRMRGELDCKD